jgi:hypothetical protein
MTTGLDQDQLIASVSTYLETLKAEREVRLQAAPATAAAIREIVFPMLAANGIAEAVIRYDGYADEGSIEDVELYDTTAQAFAPDHGIWNAHIATAADPRWKDRAFGGRVRLVLEEIAEWLLELHCDGYENNDGGYGEIRLDIAEGTMTHEHSQRRYVTDDQRFEL